jgi:hypothetical protein
LLPLKPAGVNPVAGIGERQLKAKSSPIPENVSTKVEGERKQFYY